MKKTLLLPRVHGLRPAAPRLLTALLSFAGVAWLHAAAPPASTAIRYTGTDFEGRSTYRLEWDAQSNLVYRVQSRAGLEADAPWTTYDLVRAAGTRAACDVATEQGLPPTLGARGFFQVLQPQPEVFRIEPAVVGTNGGLMTLFGQLLGTNLTARAGSVVWTVTPTVVEDKYEFSIAAGDLPPGTYDLELLEGTNVVARAEQLFSVSGQPSALGEGSSSFARLLEVPEEPPASPRAPASLLMPALMKAKEKANRTKCGNNLRIMPNGELQLCEVDFAIPGRGLDFVWARTYRSRTGTNTVMGQNWSHSYDIRCFTGSNSVTIQDGTGRHDTYQRGTNGLYTVDELFNVGEFTNDQFVLTFPDGGRWEFVPTNAVNAGRLARIVDRNDNALTLAYSAGGQLLNIVDTLGRTNTLAYGPTGRLLSITDFTGRAWTYAHYRQGDGGGGIGDLRSVTTPPVTGTPNTNDFPLGKTTTYTYSLGQADARLNRNLLTITDPAAQTWLQVAYKDSFDPATADFDRVWKVQRGAHPPTVFAYIPQTPAASNRWAVLKTMANDPEGNVTVDWFDSLNRCVIHRDLATRTTPGLTLITEVGMPGVPLRPSDPVHWETTCEWNADSLCTRFTDGATNTTEVAYQRSYNQNNARSNHAKAARASDGNPVVETTRRIRVIGPDMEPDLLTQAVRNTFDVRFGSPAARSRSGHRIIFDDTEGRERFGSGPRQTTSMDGAFITKQTDARGLVTTMDYDAHGNRVALHHQGRLLDGSDAPVTDYEYDGQGQLTAVVHPADATGLRRRDEFDYQSGRLSRWVLDPADPANIVEVWNRDARGHVIEHVDPNGNTNLFVRNALDQVVRKSSIIHCVSCSALQRDFFYDANDNVVREEFTNLRFDGSLDTNNPSWTTLYQYDLLNRRTLMAHEAAHVVQQRFATNRFVYDGNDQVLEEHSPEAVNGHQPANYVAHTYDTRGLRHTSTRAPGTADSSTDTIDYDGNGNPARVVRGMGGGGAGGSVWLRSFDGLDRLSTEWDPLGNVATFAYDANGNLIAEWFDGQTNDVPGSVGNRRLSFTRHEYDGQDRPTARRISFFDIFADLALTDGESTTTWAYAPDGALKSETDDNGHITRYAYDRKGRLASVTDAKTNVVTFTRDNNGHVTVLKSAERPDLGGPVQEFTQNFQYDELDRCVLDFDNVGNTNRYGYDSRGNLVRHLDPRGVLRGWQHDGLNNAIIIEADLDGDGEWEPLSDYQLSQEFDDNSRLVATTDANTNTTRFAYDAHDRRIATTNADGTTHKLIWSPRSNLVLTEDANGTVVSNSFDLLDRCVRRDITPGAGVLPTTTFEMFAYDGASQLVLATNDASMVEFSRNSLGLIEKGKQDCIAVAASFDGMGNRLSLTYPTGGVVHFSYDALDQVSTVSRTHGGQTHALATFAYEGPGRVGRMTRGNNINTRFTWDGAKNSPPAAGGWGWLQIASVNHQFAGGGATIDRRVAAYDRNQNKILRQQTVPFASGVPALTTNVFGYDALNRMTSFSRNRASQAHTKSLALDKQGNRQNVSSNGVVEVYVMDSKLPEPADFQMNQYTFTPFGTEAHDHNGNLVSVTGPAGTTFYSYDYADQLVLVQRTGSGGLETVAQYGYDALGRRFSKTVFPPLPALPVTTCYLRDPDTDDILEEWDNGVPQLFAVWPHMHQMGGHARISPGGATQWVHTDETGTALALTDDAGTVLERYDYREGGEPMFFTADGVPMVDAFGQPVAQSPVGSHHLFNGMEWDGETGFYFESWPCRWKAPELNSHSDSRYLNPRTGKPLTHVHGDPHVDQKDGTRWDLAVGGGGGGGGAGGMRAGVSTSRSNIRTKNSFHSSGDPIHGVDIKLGYAARAGISTSRSNLRTKSSLHGGGASGIAIDESGVHRAIAIDESGVHFTGRFSIGEPGVQVSGFSIGEPGVQLNGFSIGEPGVQVVGSFSIGEPGVQAAGGYGVKSPRDAASGLATGKRVSAPRDAASGQATGRRGYVSGHFSLDLDGKRDSASGLATGRRLHAPRDAASGLATGRRTRAPRDAASGLATGRRQ